MTTHNKAFTKVGGQAAFLRGWLTHGHGFTMAEILLSLTIIGVVAAITLPSLTGNVNERVWNTQKKALYARFSQAIAIMPYLNSFGTLSVDAEGNITDTAAETFLTEGLSKVLKINNICDSEHLEDCGVPNQITPYSGDVITPFPKTLKDFNIDAVTAGYNNGGGDSASYSQTNTKTAAFETQNGESVAVFYNPTCISDTKAGTHWVPVQESMCVNFVYDLNGSKGPNAMGKDIGFITVFNPMDSIVVAPIPYQKDSDKGAQVPTSASEKSASQICSSIDSGEWRLPNKQEGGAIFINKKMTGDYKGDHYWTSTVERGSSGVAISIHTGAKLLYARSSSIYVRCVKR